MDTGKFALSIWSQSNPDGESAVGKRFDLDEDGNLVKGRVSVWANEMTVDTFDDLSELQMIIDEHSGKGAFFTCGIPENWKDLADDGQSVPVTSKYASPRAKKNTIQRTKERISGQPGVGTYFVVDFDTAGCPWDETPDARELHDRIVAAAKLGGLDLSNARCMAYKSSSSSVVRESDGYRYDKGGCHLVFLVEDSSDLDRFRDSLNVYLTLSGSCFGRISASGSFLRRGVLDCAAARHYQPTFMSPPYCGPGLRSERGLLMLGGKEACIDSHQLRDPTTEEVESHDAFWATERERLKPQARQAESDWKRAKRKEIRQLGRPCLSEQAVDDILDRRLRGQLLAPDIVHFDNGESVTVAEILADPAKYDERTCADPLEPDLDHGRNKAIVYANLDRDEPILFSHRGGGASYRLMHDSESLLQGLSAVDPSQHFDFLSRSMRSLYTSSSAEGEATMKKIAKRTDTTKLALAKDYGAALAKNRKRPSRVEEVDDGSGDAPNVDSIEYRAARKIRNQNRVVSTHGSRGPELWTFTGNHWRRYPDGEAARDLLNVLVSNGWAQNQGRTSRAAQDSVMSLKQQSFVLQPPFRSATNQIINCRNGELWFDENGDVELRAHSQDSGLTYVLPVDYCPDASSTLLADSIEQMFLPPFHALDEASEEDQAKFLSDARLMANYILEIMAYILVPVRWLANWFLLIGNGSNGKTLLMKVLQKLLPDEAVVNERLRAISEDNFGMARLRDKTVLIDDDLDTGITLPDGFLKKVSEAKRLSANVKHNPNDVSFENRCAVVLLSNNYPRLMDVSHGTLRRIRAIEFPRQFYSPQQIADMPRSGRQRFQDDVADPTLLEKLADDLPSVLNLLIAAYARLKKRGDFQIPDPAKKATNRAICMAHPLKQFIEEHCAVDDDRYVARTEFQHQLNVYNSDQKNRWTPTPQQIRHEMQQLGFPVRQKRFDNKVAEAYIGLSLKNRPPFEIVPDLGGDAAVRSTRKRRRTRERL